MRKVSKEEFIRMPAGTLYSIPKSDSNYESCIMIKMDTGYEYVDKWSGKTLWNFLGTMPLNPGVPFDEETHRIEKWLGDYQLNEYIKPEWSVGDDSPCDFDSNDTIIVYDVEEIKFMIKLLQTLCINHNFDDEEIDKRLE